MFSSEEDENLFGVGRERLNDMKKGGKCQLTRLLDHQRRFIRSLVDIRTKRRRVIPNPSKDKTIDSVTVMTIIIIRLTEFRASKHPNPSNYLIR